MLSELEGLRQGSPGLWRERLWGTGMGIWLLEGVQLADGSSVQDLLYSSFPQVGPCWARWQMCQKWNPFEFISKAQSFKSDRLGHQISCGPWKALSPLCLPMLSFVLQGAGRPPRLSQPMRKKHVI